ncbi:DUF29 domain-containing protein [Paraburkholderia sp. GAS348]|jgi:hypothetical protein|uniref:DUF29 domain-containing protein n=1 Tax=Paraburkholderia sp. GAS348 TaxID=3035132 RepID=UPI003D1A51E8
MVATHDALYERDFYAWANEQAALLRSGKLADADLGHIAEEIESMGRSEKRELVNRLTILLTHLLKWQFQSAFRGRSWQLTVIEQRRKVVAHLEDNPSLKGVLPSAFATAYGYALIEAERETGLPESTFPASSPYTVEQVFDEGFWPDA